jgi:hypothetical protein
MRETARSMGERILAYSHDTGLHPAMRRIARKTTFASAYGDIRWEPSFSRLLQRPCSCIPAPAPGRAIWTRAALGTCHVEQVVTRATTSKAGPVLSSSGRPTLPYADSAPGLTARVNDARDRYRGSAAAWTCDLAVQTFE